MNIAKEKTTNERYVEKWFADNGFHCELIKQYISKTKYYICKDNITQEFLLPYEIKNINSFMMQFAQNWEVLLERNRLRERLQE